MDKIEMVIFDMDGLMFDTEALALQVYEKLCRDYGCEYSREFYLSLLGTTEMNANKAFQDRFGQGFPALKFNDELIARLNTLIEQEGLPCKHGLQELLLYLKRQPVKKALGSSNNKSIINRYLQIAKLQNEFDSIISGDDVLQGKPDPAIFLESCHMLKINPRHAVVLEDSEKGVEAAAAAGIRCILVPDLLEPSLRHQELAWATVRNLLEVKTLLQQHGLSVGQL